MAAAVHCAIEPCLDRPPTSLKRPRQHSNVLVRQVRQACFPMNNSMRFMPPADNSSSSTCKSETHVICFIRAELVPPESATQHLSPEDYLLGILRERGYAGKATLNSSASRGFRRTPSPLQVKSYDKLVADIVRSGNASKLRHLAQHEGRCLSACNKFGESLAHLACRNGDLATLKVIIENGGSLTQCDDLQRLPLHWAAWADAPQWDVIRAHLDADDTLLVTTDLRGWTPLRYIKRANHGAWRDFLDGVKDHYWPRR